MLNLPKAAPNLVVVGSHQVDKLTPVRQKTVALRPLERRQLQRAAAK
jgi:hypothetical protein